MITSLVRFVTGHLTALLIAAAAAAILLVLLVFLARWVARRVPPGTPWWYYLGSLGGLAVSLNTSWRFFGERLFIVGPERVIMFAVVELALVACALGMRANVRRVDPVTGRPGAAGTPRLVAWVLCGLAAYAALLLSGPVEGVARVALGPVLSLVMLHLALGIEIRHTATRTTTWARVIAELRERALSRFGLADDDRDAKTRTRQRAARRAARLVVATHAPARTARLARALRAADVAHDPALREWMMAELAVLRHASALADLPLPSPWTTTPEAPAIPAPPVSAIPFTAPPVPPPPVVEDPPPTTVVFVEPTDTPTVPAPANGKANRSALALVPSPSETTLTDGRLDGVVLLTASTQKAWTAMTKDAAIDLADQLLPDRPARQLAVALAEVGITVADSTISHRRSERIDPDDDHPVDEQYDYDDFDEHRDPALLNI